MKTDYSTVLLARNKVKQQYKIYLYEAEKIMLTELSKQLPNKISVSDTAHAIIAWFLVKTKHDYSYLKEKDIIKIKALDRAIA